MDNGAGRAWSPGAIPPEEYALRVLHQDHAAALWRYALRLTRGDEARAQDAVQETLLRAWRHPRVLGTSGDHARRWLFTTLRTRVIDEWRARQVRPEVVTDQVPERQVADHVDTAIQGLVVTEALRKLTPAHRQVLVECFYGGRSVNEAAERIGIPPGTVKSRLYYALRALKLALEEAGVITEENR
ncbi:RNA polymerase sigma-70 factor (ECF subfamily) [Stackebrandtia endophytica]|uniref:RNA polymerase sigma-70 factor (ECF subfamily) n=1 Tax=Stackebrandtia endophytica TaxID=1496996 RepID=A0A543AZ69_9ACTN|nr:sigma-70 family RNA polymerase sigma factor [Stackebrandtia endophytica]TQL77810.1 RNA polymerase sigma-70 factor (ECF subfamily) [Stackebrandtia endophytica]